MSLPTDVVACPRCSVGIPWPIEPPEFRCRGCSLTGRLYGFKPIAPRRTRTELAGEEDQVCVHHPDKQAVASCSGTGDFICDLCRVEVEGRDFSVQFLEANPNAAGSFANTVPRPDSVVIGCLVGCLVFWPFAPILLPTAVVFYVKLLSERRSNATLAKLVGPGRLAILTGVLVLACLVAGLAVIGFIGLIGAADV